MSLALVILYTSPVSISVSTEYMLYKAISTAWWRCCSVPVFYNENSGTTYDTFSAS
jgi:hypothetical protein